MGAQSNFGASFHICSFWPSDPSRIAVVSVACMPVGHGAWKASEPLSDLDQLLSIAMHDPNVSAKQVVGVYNTQQRLVHPLPHTFLPYEVPAVFFTRRTTWPHGNRDSSSRSTATRTFFSLICGFTACSSSPANWLSSYDFSASLSRALDPQKSLQETCCVAETALNVEFLNSGL